MRTLIFQFIETIFPSRATQRLVSEATSVIPELRVIHTADIAVHYIVSYYDQTVRALITEAKFHNDKHAQKILGQTFKSGASTLFAQADVIIPLPLSTERRRERGYNQIEAILSAASLPYTNQVMTRAHRPPQTSLRRAQRLQNMREAFFVTKPKLVRNKRIILIDDVLTTGATMAAARATLVQHSPTSITCLALAH